jgi:hypothetical protein
MRKSPLKRKTPLRGKPKKRKPSQAEAEAAFGAALCSESMDRFEACVHVYDPLFPAFPFHQPKKEPGRDPAYLAFLRTQPCCVCGTEERTQAAHQGKHGTGTKASDYGALPLCGTGPSLDGVGMREGCHQMQHRAGMLKTVLALSPGWWQQVTSDLMWTQDAADYFLRWHQSRLLRMYLEGKR